MSSPFYRFLIWSMVVSSGTSQTQCKRCCNRFYKINETRFLPVRLTVCRLPCRTLATIQKYTRVIKHLFKLYLPESIKNTLIIGDKKKASHRSQNSVIRLFVGKTSRAHALVGARAPEKERHDHTDQQVSETFAKGPILPELILIQES